MVTSNKIILFVCLVIGAWKLDAQSDWKEVISAHRQKYYSEYPYLERKPFDAGDTMYLDFFEADSQYIVQATFEAIEGATPFEMPTYSGGSKPFQAFGYVYFVIGQDSLRLTTYQNLQHAKHPLYKNSLFLPFKDVSNGETTYGGGRYLELNKWEIDPDNQVILNFNLAYNPWCAYGDGFNCPVPPAENQLPVSIEAGEKQFRKNEH